MGRKHIRVCYEEGLIGPELFSVLDERLAFAHRHLDLVSRQLAEQLVLWSCALGRHVEFVTERLTAHIEGVLAVAAAFGVPLSCNVRGRSGRVAIAVG